MAGTETITLTAQDLADMDPAELQRLLLKATKIEATAVVRDADGNVKYDDPALAGTFGEQHLTGALNGEHQPRRAGGV